MSAQLLTSVDTIKDILKNNKDLAEQVTDAAIKKALDKVELPGFVEKVVGGALDILLPDILFDSLREIIEKNAGTFIAGSSSE